MSLNKRQVIKRRVSKKSHGRRPMAGLVSILASMIFAIGLIGAFWSGEGVGATAGGGSAEPAVQTERLEAGAVVEKDINGQETQSYNFSLDAGMYMRIVVSQKLGDVTINLLNSKGEKIHWADRAGEASLSVIAKGPESYQVRIISSQRAGVPGRYELRLENLHATTQDDRQRLAAEQLVNEGADLIKKGAKADTKEALVRLNKAGRIWESLGDTREQAASYYFLAQAYEDIGELDDSRKADENALSLSRSISDQIRESLVLSHLGVLAYRVSDYDQALDYFMQSANVSRAAGNLYLEQSSLANSGVISKNRKNYDQAIGIYTRALDVAANMGDRSVEASILNNIARVYDLKGDKQKAIDTYERLLPVWSGIGQLDGESTTLKNIGAVYESIGQSERALQKYQQALDKATQIGNPNREGHIHGDLARVYRAIGRNDLAKSEVEKALTIFESLRARLANPSQRASFAGSNRKYTDLYLELLSKNQKVSAVNQERIFEYSERSRARSMLEMLRAASVDFRQGADPSLLAREAQLVKQIQSKDTIRLQLLSSGRVSDQSKNIERELSGLYVQYENLISDIRKASPQLASLTQYEPVKIQDLQKRLVSDRAVMLEYYLGDQQSYLIAVAPDSLTTYVLPPRKQIEDLARTLYDSLSAPTDLARLNSREAKLQRMARAEKDFNYSAGELSRILIDPVRNQIADRKLLIVPDGVLNYVPFSALPDPRGGVAYTPMIVKNEIVNLPSAATFLELKPSVRTRIDAPLSVAVMADPVFSRNDARFEQLTANNIAMADEQSSVDVMQTIMTRGSADEGIKLLRLKYSRQEANAIASLADPRSRLVALDFNANRDFFNNDQLSRFRYLHIATHGLMDSKNPALSGLILSLVDENGKSRDGIMGLQDIYNLKLNADLVVLSACQTALGREIKGEGIMGLTRGFMYAGARRVVSSLWMVDDAATSELMKTFYEGMLKDKMEPSAALRAAQIAMWKKGGWQHPYFWAGFVMQGEPE